MESLKAYQNRIGRSLIRSTGVNSRASQMLLNARKIRDSRLWDWPILPGAVSAYVDLASSREWSISGKPRAVARAVEFLNTAQTYDLATGEVYIGFEQFQQRRALDNICIGRTALLKPKNKRKHLEYLDATYLNQTVKDDKIVYEYADGRVFTPDEVVFHHPLPIGTSNFMSPIHSLAPTATLAWLIREHDTAKLDGRKLRDIIFVANAEMVESVQLAIQQMAALWSGADPSQVGGVPLVEINNPSGTPLSNYIYRLGLSEIPESFNREQFIDEYVNQIAATLGLALRHFWNNEKTTNRALEEVQEMRQQQKGPAMFVRSEERIINHAGLFDHIAPRGTLTFSFIEETDTSAQLTHARVLYNYVLALERIQKVFGTSIDLQAYLAWMQSIHMLPNDITLVNNSSNDVQIAVSDASIYADRDEVAVDSSSPRPLKTLNYDEVTMDSNGRIIEKRFKVFKSIDLFKEKPIQNNDENVFFTLAKDATNEINNYVLTNLFEKLLKMHPHLAQKLKAKQPLTDEEQRLIDALYWEAIDGEEDI